MSYGSTEIRSTDFAITTVNVPDRLDLRDIDDRKQLDDDSRLRRFDTTAFRAWAPRLFLMSLLVAIAFVLFEGIDTWRTSLSASQLSQRLTASLGVPVQIADSQFAISPAPQLILQKVSIDGQVVLDEVSISIGYKQLGQAFQGHGWNWGEAVVTTKPLTIEQCRLLLALLPRLDGAFPKTLSALRFERLEIADQPWLAGPWEISISRGKGVGMTAVSAAQHKDKGSLQLDLSPGTVTGGYAFQLEGRNWKPPFGANFHLEEVVATGQISPTHLEVGQFSIGGPFGAATGQISAQLDDAWTLAGSARSEGIDLESLIRLVAAAPSTDENTPETPTVIQGTASFVGRIDGKGKTLVDAVSAASFEAPVHVRSAVLTGINLGYAATRPSLAGVTSGGSTRFSSMDTTMVSTANQVVFRNISAHAGALAASGQVDLKPDHSLTGHLHVDLGETRVLAPIRVAVRGTVLKPEFGR
jgi:hypothetical protein